MRARFQADADLKQAIVASIWRHEPAVDIQAAGEGDLIGKQDPEVLQACAKSGRILVSHDGRTMPHHFAEFLAQGESPGIMIVPQSLPVAVAVDELVLIWAATDASEWVNRICRLPL